MMGRVMTLKALASHERVARVVGRKPTARWKTADPLVRRGDDYSIASWFKRHGPAERIAMVQRALVEAQVWTSLLRVLITKGPNTTEKRPIDMPTVLDQARLYVIYGWLCTYAETVLSKVAIAFRPGRSMSDTVGAIHGRMGTLVWAMPLDIRDFYGSLTWPRLDKLIAGLPAEDRVKQLLRALVRVEIVDRMTGTTVIRRRGVPQGLSVSPVLANLFMADWDRQVVQAIAKLGCRLWRYCDDILILAPSEGALGRAGAIVSERLERLELTLKSGTGGVVDLRSGPLTWLGLSWTVGGLDVPDSVIRAKSADLQGRYDNGLLTREGIEDSLAGRLGHYQRILDPTKAEEIINSMRGLLNLSGSPMRRKEGLERLREVTRER